MISIHFLALAKNTEEVINRIANNPEELNRIDENGLTPLKVVCSSGKSGMDEVITTLVEGGSPVGDAVHRLTTSGTATKEILEYLVGKGANINASTLDNVLSKGPVKADVLDFVLQYVDKDVVLGKLELTPLEKAAANLKGNDLDVAVEVLLKRGAKLDLVKSARALVLADAVDKYLTKAHQHIKGLEEVVLQLTQDLEKGKLL